MLPRRTILALGASLLVAVGCSAPAASKAPVAPSATAVAATTCATSPEPTNPPGWEMPAQKPQLTPVIVTNWVACGKTRVLFLFLDDQNNVVSAPDRTAKIAFYDLAKDPAKPVVTADGTFMWTIEGERGMYAVNVELPTAGLWGAELTTAAPDSPAETSRMQFEVHDSSPTVAIGHPAPASKTPTLSDVGGDAAQISTDEHPDPAFYQTSVADALAAHKPIMLVFATPKFCTSKQCGPTLDTFKPIAKANPDVTFINVEPYQLHEVDGQLQPVLSDTNQLKPTDITDAWGLLSEPWIFAIDRDGIVRGSYEILISPAELEAILPVIRAGG